MKLPRLSWQSCITSPTYSGGEKISARTIGSSTCSMLVTGGNFVGLSISNTSPVVVCTLYTTLGAVVTRSRSNSLSRRSWMISICNNPKKPHLKPNPKATEVSGSYVKEASLSFSFSKDSFKSLYLLPSAGKIPQNTIGFTSL